mgnify:CR=1 FL=1
MLGSCFLKHLAGDKDFEMYAFDRSNLDITSFQDLEKVFKKISPDFVINCAAYTNVDEAETNKDLAYKINSRAAGAIAKVCKQENAILIHFSTDYVFDGQNPNGYDEEAETNPINVYGESKLAGEKLIKTYTDNHYIIRTSWLYGQNGKNFVSTMIKLSSSNERIKVINDQNGSPTYTNDLVITVLKYFLQPFLLKISDHHERMLTVQKKQHKKLPFGTYHLSNSGQCSWADFAREIFKFSNKKTEVINIGSNDYKTKAKRPSCSVLNNNKLSNSMRSWQDALAAYLKLHF